MGCNTLSGRGSVEVIKSRKRGIGTERFIHSYLLYPRSLKKKKEFRSQKSSLLLQFFSHLLRPLSIPISPFPLLTWDPAPLSRHLHLAFPAPSHRPRNIISYVTPLSTTYQSFHSSVGNVYTLSEVSLST